MTKKQKNIIMLALICFTFALTIFYYNNIKIPSIEKETMQYIKLERDLDKMPKKKVAIVKNHDGLNKYTVLNEKIISNMIEIVEIPDQYVIDKPVVDVDQLKNKIVNNHLNFNQQISLNNLIEKKDWFGDFDRLKEYKVKSLVADTAKEGNIVDLVVNYGNGDYDVVLSKIKINKIISPFDDIDNDDENDNSNLSNAANRKDEEKQFLVVFSIKNEEEYRNLELANKLGVFETRLYIDESQCASLITFDYEKAKNKLKLNNTTKKNMPIIVSKDDNKNNEEGEIKLDN